MPEINQYGQQVNDVVVGWQGASVLKRSALTGRYCRLEPLDTRRHAADLFAAYALGDGSDWTWLASTRPETVEATAHWVAGKVGDDALVPFAVIDLGSGQAVGLVSFMAIEQAMGSVEIGHVTWSRKMKNTPLEYRGGLAAADVRVRRRLSAPGVEVRLDEYRLPPGRRAAGLYLGRAPAPEAGAQGAQPRQRHAVDYRRRMAAA